MQHRQVPPALARRSVRGLIATLAAGVLALTACTAPQNESAAPEDAVSLVVEDAPAPLDAEALGMIDAGTEEEDAGDGSVSLADLATFPGSGPMVQELSDTLGEDVALAVVAASRQVIGVVPQEDEAVYYGDLTTGMVSTAADLLTTQGAAALAALVGSGDGADGDGAEGEQASEGGTEQTIAAPAPRDVRFTAEGDLLVVEGARSARIPRAETDGWLTAEGRAVRAAARSQSDLTTVAADSGDLDLVAQSVPLPPPAKVPAPPASKPDRRPSGGGTGGVDCSVESCVALTFDDGPNAQTSRLLGILADRGVKATFFMVGQSVASNPAIARAAADAGHQLGNHTWRHPDLTTLDAAGVRDQLASTENAIEEATGIVPTIQRPPYGAWDETVKSVSGDLGLSLILWDVDTLDWQHRDPAKTLEIVKANTHRGSIVLMHDIHSTSVDAVNDVISYLQGEGHTLVTVDQLMGGSTSPGSVYYSGR